MDKEYKNIKSFCKSYYQAIGATNFKVNIFKKNIKEFFCFIDNEGITISGYGIFNKKDKRFSYEIIKLECNEKIEYVCEKNGYSAGNSRITSLGKAQALTFSILKSVNYYGCIKKVLESGKDLPDSEIFHPNPLFLNDSELEKIAELSKEYGVNIL